MAQSKKQKLVNAAQRLYAVALTDPVAAFDMLRYKNAKLIEPIPWYMEGTPAPAKELVALLVDSASVWECIDRGVQRNEKYTILAFFGYVRHVVATSDAVMQRIFVTLAQMHRAEGPPADLRDFLHKSGCCLSEREAPAFLAAAQDNPELFQIVPSEDWFNYGTKGESGSFVMLKARLDAVQPDTTGEDRDLRSVLNFVAGGHYAAAVHLCLVSASARAAVTRCAAAQRRWEAAPDRIKEFSAQLTEMRAFFTQLRESLPCDTDDSAWHCQGLGEFENMTEHTDEKLDEVKFTVQECTPQAARAALALRLPGSVYGHHCAVLMATGLPQFVIMRILEFGQPELSAALPEHVRAAIETRTRAMYNNREASAPPQETKRRRTAE